MDEPLYTARSSIHKIAGTHRRARLEDGTTVEFGVHGAIRQHFGLLDEKNLPLPVDYIAAATGAWMLGTLNGALEARGIKLEPDMIKADVAGRNDVVDGVIRLTRIDIHYTLRIPEGTRDKVDRALARHQDRCPTARSLAPAVDISWTADISESG